MPIKELEDARGQIKVRGAGGFRWPDFLALGPGAFIGAWNPPDLTGLAGWIKNRAHRYGVQLDVKVRQDHNGSGSVEFSTQNSHPLSGNYTHTGGLHLRLSIICLPCFP